MSAPAGSTAQRTRDHVPLPPGTGVWVETLETAWRGELVDYDGAETIGGGHLARVRLEHDGRVWQVSRGQVREATKRQVSGPTRTSRTVQVGDRLTMSDVPLGTVVALTRWLADERRNGWSARLTFDDGRELTLAPGTALPVTAADTIRFGDCTYGRPFVDHHGRTMVGVYEDDGDRYVTYGVPAGLASAWATRDGAALCTCGRGAPVVALLEGTYPACEECADEARAHGANTTPPTHGPVPGGDRAACRCGRTFDTWRAQGIHETAERRKANR